MSRFSILLIIPFVIFRSETKLLSTIKTNEQTI